MKTGEELSAKKEKTKRNFPLKRIYFYLTEGCNLICRHCWIMPKHQTEIHKYPSLPFDLFKSIVEQGIHLGLSEIKLTGGEPLLHPEIFDILKFVQEKKLSLEVETNGTLCSLEMAQKIAACQKAFVSVSLDGAIKEIHEWIRGVEGCFNDALEGIRNLVKAGLSPQIIVSVMRHNKDQLEDIVCLAESLKVGSVKFNLVQPSGRGKKLHQNRETLSVKELIELGQWVENTLVSSKKIHIHYNYPPAFRPLGKIFDKDGTGYSSCGILGIIGVLSDGAYALCGIGTQVPELVFGHAAADRLEDVWNHSPVLLELRAGIPQHFKGVCSNCLMKGFCMGKCIAMNYLTGKNLWEPFWFCKEAYNLSLFPETRIRPS